MNSLAYKSYVSDLTIQLGNLTTTGRLTPIRKPAKEPEFVLIAPDTKEPVYQVFRDPDGRIWEKKDLGRAVEEPKGVFTPVDPDAVLEARRSKLPPNVLTLTAHTREDVERHCFPSDHNAYVFDYIKKDRKGKPVKPNPRDVQTYNILYRLLETEDIAFLGICNIRQYEGLYRLTTYHGNLMLQRQLYPNEVYEYEPKEIELPKAVERKAKSLVGKMIQKFDPDQYRDATVERLKAIEAGDFESNATPIEEELDEEDILELLDNFEL